MVLSDFHENVAERAVGRHAFFQPSEQESPSKNEHEPPKPRGTQAP